MNAKVGACLFLREVQLFNAILTVKACNMKITVSLKRSEAEKIAVGELRVNLPKLIGNPRNTTVLKVFGRGRYANIETTPGDLAELKSRIGHVCVFSTNLKARPF